jgi:hypothetical protein
VLHAPGDLAPLDLLLGQVEDRFVRSGLVQQLDGAADRLAELLVAKVALLAETDEQHPVGERPADAVQQQRHSQLPLHVAAPDDLADVAIGRAIDQLGGQRELAIVENTDDDARAALLLGAAAFYGKFHRAPRFWSLTFLCRKGVAPAHYRQNAVKKSKFSRRHDFPA